MPLRGRGKERGGPWERRSGRTKKDRPKGVTGRLLSLCVKKKNKQNLRREGNNRMENANVMAVMNSGLLCTSAEMEKRGDRKDNYRDREQIRDLFLCLCTERGG